MMKPKRVKKTLADGTTKIYEYERTNKTDEVVSNGTESDGFIYFIQADSGPIKIGFSRDLRQRIRDLHGHEGLTLLAAFHGDRALERRLHRLFVSFRRRGEWFQPHPIIFREIRELAEDAIRGAQAKAETITGNHAKPVKNTA